MQFCVTSYNQENLIIQTLESIKYQVEHFQSNEKPSFALFDDCSSDMTVEYATAWIELNRSLFSEVSICPSQKNKGIVKNFLSAVRSNPQKYCKEIAGDDLFAPFDIRKAFPNEGICLTPTIRFSGGKQECIFSPALDLISKERDPQKGFEKAKKFFSSRRFIEAPGVFYSKSFFFNEGLVNYLDKFSWIEDAPTWSYFFEQGCFEQSVCVDLTPYTLYRTSGGVSDFESEAECIYNEDWNLLEKDRKPYFSGLKKIESNVINVGLFAYGKIHQNDNKSYTTRINKSLDEISEYISIIEGLAEESKELVLKKI